MCSAMIRLISALISRNCYTDGKITSLFCSFLAQGLHFHIQLFFVGLVLSFLCSKLIKIVSHCNDDTQKNNKPLFLLPPLIKTRWFTQTMHRSAIVQTVGTWKLISLPVSSCFDAAQLTWKEKAASLMNVLPHYSIFRQFLFRNTLLFWWSGAHLAHHFNVTVCMPHVSRWSWDMWLVGCM